MGAVESGAVDDQRSADLDEIYSGIRFADFLALDEDALWRRASLLLEDDDGLMALGPHDYLEELSRRATDRHTKQVEVYAQRLDRLTRWLVGLTVALVILTLALIGLELGIIGAGG